MFCALTYLFGHSIYFARLRHVNPQCKHKCAFLQMKEAPNQKVQEKKPLLKFKNTKKNMCLERIRRKNCFRACRHRPLMHKSSVTPLPPPLQDSWEESPTPPSPPHSYTLHCNVECSPDTVRPLEGNRGNMCPPLP